MPSGYIHRLCRRGEARSAPSGERNAVIAELPPSAWRFLASRDWFCDTPEEKKKEKGLKLANHSCSSVLVGTCYHDSGKGQGPHPQSLYALPARGPRADSPPCIAGKHTITGI
jgi:hypothetical protein